MDTHAIVFTAPGKMELTALPLIPQDSEETLVDVLYSGISTGTERLLWTGQMPPFPGMGYPLVPGYETVGRVSRSASGSGFSVGDLVFVPGANCYGPVRGLFGGAASRISIPAGRLVKLDADLKENGTLLALAATAYHAVALSNLPDLIVGHGVLGRLLARITVALGHVPTVWETSAERRSGSVGYSAVDPASDTRKDYAVILDASGDHRILDLCMQHLARNGEIVLAGFYHQPVSFAFPPAFMREATIRIAAQWQPGDLAAVLDLVRTGRLSLDGLITHRQPANKAQGAYETAFNNTSCLKMVIDWSEYA